MRQEVLTCVPLFCQEAGGSSSTSSFLNFDLCCVTHNRNLARCREDTLKVLTAQVWHEKGPLSQTTTWAFVTVKYCNVGKRRHGLNHVWFTQQYTTTNLFCACQCRLWPIPCKCCISQTAFIPISMKWGALWLKWDIPADTSPASGDRNGNFHKNSAILKLTVAPGMTFQHLPKKC